MGKAAGQRASRSDVEAARSLLNALSGRVGGTRGVVRPDQIGDDEVLVDGDVRAYRKGATLVVRAVLAVGRFGRGTVTVLSSVSFAAGSVELETLVAEVTKRVATRAQILAAREEVSRAA